MNGEEYDEDCLISDNKVREYYSYRENIEMWLFS